MRLTTLMALAAVVAVAGCGSTTDDLLGQGKRSPDEFAVYARAPLTLPPDYNLRPPTPGAERRDDSFARREAEHAILGGQPAPSGAGVNMAAVEVAEVSPGVAVVMEQTGAFQADPAIRSLVNDETSILAEEDQSFIERLIFWGTPDEYGHIVDPVNEAKRINQNQALGEPVTTGTTPVIERRPRGLLEDLF